MRKVFFDVATSVDGVMAPPATADESTWMKDWMEIVNWMFGQRFFRANLKLGEGGETGEENRMLEEVYARTGTSIMGKTMFRYGEKGWPEDAPFHTPVFVLTHEPREPLVRPGGTTFHFVTDGIYDALGLARKAAGDKDVRIAGGVNTIRQYLNAGLVDEFTLHQAPTVLGRGLRLFDSIDRTRFSLDVLEAARSPHAIHLRFRVRNAERGTG